MLFKVRTPTGWIELTRSEIIVRYWPNFNVAEHNSFMNTYYPIKAE